MKALQVPTEQKGPASIGAKGLIDTGPKNEKVEFLGEIYVGMDIGRLHHRQRPEAAQPGDLGSPFVRRLAGLEHQLPGDHVPRLEGDRGRGVLADGDGQLAVADDPLARQQAIEDRASSAKNRPHKPDLDEMTVGRTEVPLSNQPHSSGGKPGTRTTKSKTGKVRRT